MALPALRKLREAFPSAHIAVITNEYIGNLFTGCPYVDEQIPGFAYRRRGVAARVALHLQALRSVIGRYDMALLFRNPPRFGSLVAFLSGASIRAGSAVTKLDRLLLIRQSGAPPWPHREPPTGRSTGGVPARWKPRARA